MTEVSPEERDAWLREHAAQALREQLASSFEMAREELMARGLRSNDAHVRAAAERAQTLLELIGMLQPGG